MKISPVSLKNCGRLCPLSLGSERFWEIVLIIPNDGFLKPPDERSRAFCWAGSLVKVDLDWQYVVRRSYQNIS